MMKTHLITGVAGFIGSHLAETLLQQGYAVIGVDEFNDYYDPRFKRQNVASLLNHENFQLVEANILNLNWLELLQDVEVIYHQAAQAGVRASWGEGFFAYTERNVNATQVLLEAAANSTHLKRFVFASSSSVYGNAETLPTSEAICPDPVSPYGITKLASEQLCRLYYQNFGVPIVALRYFTVYGPRQRPDMAFHKFLKAILQGQAINIYGDGQQTRDFTFIQDAIAANLAAATAEKAPGEVLNIGGGSRVVLAEVIDTIEAITQRLVQRRYVQKAMGDARHTAADISKAQEILGYQPQVSLREGLTQQWQWIRTVYKS